MDMSLELSDIQGNIIAGFNTDVEILLGLGASDVSRLPDAARWIAGLADAVTSVSDVRSSRTAMRSITDETAPVWLAVAVSHRLLSTTQPDTIIPDEAFQRGMLQRAPSVLGDFTDPATWSVGGPDKPLDILLIVASNSETAASRRAADLLEAGKRAGLSEYYQEIGRRLDDREHFGFRDGISQPVLIGDRSSGDTSAAAFLFGVTDDARATLMFRADPRGLTKNGSLLVFRRLAQDVSSFRRFCDSEVLRLAPQWPGLTTEHLAALIVGRWPSGTPVSIAVTADPEMSPPDNSFDFSTDPAAQVCPFGAHIRKVNPRKGSRDAVEVPRILRRGIPFGPPFAESSDNERGLLFLAYQSVIKDQFEFLTGSWMNRADRPTPNSGNDLLVGRSRSIRSLTINGPSGPVTIQDATQAWITPTGGAYLFAPGKAALARFAGPSSLFRHSVVTNLNVTDANAQPLEPQMRQGLTTWARVCGRDTLVSAHWPVSRLGTNEAKLLRPHSLQHLDLSGQYFPTEILTRKDIEELSSEKALVDVSVHGVSIAADTFIPLLAQMSALRGINVCGLDITDRDIQDLPGAVPYLNELRVGGTRLGEKRHRFDSSRLTANAWSPIQRLNQLTQLSFRDVPLDDTTILTSPDLITRLETLDLGDTHAGDATAEALAQSQVLRKLSLDGTRIGDKGASALATVPTLYDLDISRTRVGELGVRLLIQRGRWRRLALSDLRVGDDALVGLSALRELEDLDLSGNGVGSATVSAIAALPRLYCLNLDRTAITDSDVSVLTSSPVHDLSLQGIPMHQPSINALARCANLKSLTIQLGSDWSGLGGHTASIRLTARPPSTVQIPERLRELRLIGDLTPDLRDRLADLKELEQIQITGGGNLLSDIGPQSFGRVRVVSAEFAGLDDYALDRLCLLPELEELYISGNNVSGAVARIRTPYLNTLELRNTPVDDTVISALASLPRLHCLDLPNTNVTPNAIADLVAGARNLQSLALDARQITPSTVDAMARTAILELYLYGESVDDSTVSLLRAFPALRELNLNGTSVTDAVISHIIALPGLRTLRLNGSQLSAVLQRF